jgi:PAS domain S-box-containing protein
VDFSFDISIFDRGPVVLLAWDGNMDAKKVHPLLHASPNVESLLGYSAKELLAREVEYSNLIHEDDIDRVVGNIKGHHDRGQFSFTDQYRIRTKSGDIIWVSDHSQTVHGTNDESDIIYGYVSDITDFIQTQHYAENLRIERIAAEQSAKRKTQFLANMSHEIRTPMNGMIGMADVLSRTELNAKQADIVQTMIRSGNSLIDIVNDILDYSKIESNKIELESVSFQMDDLIHEVVNLIKAGRDNKNVEFLVRIQPEIAASVIGDKGRIMQVFTNLIGNASKFTDNGHILVDIAGMRQEHLIDYKIEVSDTGIGIAAHKLDEIFDKFNQADNSTTREYGGTGLGLAISSSLVQLMGGALTVKSELGVGSTFSVSLSLRSEADQSCITNAGAVGSPKTALILDDNKIHLDILRDQMTTMGHKVASFESWGRALKALNIIQKRKLPLHILILDYDMTDIKGEAFLKLARARGLAPHVKVVFLTPYSDENLSKRLYGLGAQAVLTKPIKEADLLWALEGLDDRMKATEPALGAVEQKVTARPRFELQRPKILVAEDNAVNQDFFEQALNILGYPFDIVGDGLKAVEYWQLNRPPIILMDISMPNMSGLKASQNIRHLERLESQNKVPPTHIIAVTAHAFKSDKQSCIKAGMDAVVTKPFTLKDLEQALKAAPQTAPMIDVRKTA